MIVVAESLLLALIVVLGVFVYYETSLNEGRIESLESSFMSMVREINNSEEIDDDIAEEAMSKADLDSIEDAVRWAVDKVDEEYALSVRQRYGDVPEAHGKNAREKVKSLIGDLPIDFNADDDELNLLIDSIVESKRK